MTVVHSCVRVSPSRPHQERRAALLKEREEARARGEEPQNAIDAARAKAVKHKEAAAAAAAMAGGTTFSIDEDEATQVVEKNET